MDNVQIDAQAVIDQLSNQIGAQATQLVVANLANAELTRQLAEARAELATQKEKS